MRSFIVLVFMIMLAMLDARGMTYQELPEVKKLISILNKNSNKCLIERNKRFCKKGKKLKTKGTGWCYKYVKIGLLKSKMTPVYIGGGSAKDAGPYLKEYGFINLLEDRVSSPAHLPNGSILVYETFSIHGHIEVKINNNKFISDHIRKSTAGRLLGVYIRKDLLEQNKIDDKSKEERYVKFMDARSLYWRSQKQSRKRSCYYIRQCSQNECRFRKNETSIDDIKQQQCINGQNLLRY